MCEAFCEELEQRDSAVCLQQHGQPGGRIHKYFHRYATQNKVSLQIWAKNNTDYLDLLFHN